jgi:hypothetical protein
MEYIHQYPLDSICRPERIFETGNRNRGRDPLCYLTLQEARSPMHASLQIDPPAEVAQRLTRRSVRSSRDRYLENVRRAESIHL